MDATPRISQFSFRNYTWNMLKNVYACVITCNLKITYQLSKTIEINEFV